MAVALAPFPVYRAANNNGNPLAGGLVETYAAGTFTPLATYVDPAGVTPNSNPVVLDASGRANIYFTVGVAYKIRQRDSTGVILWTVDNFIVSPQGDPTLINDYSATVAQSEEVLDPGEVGTEVLAQSIADELKELRFIIREMKGTGSWRTSNTVRHMAVWSSTAANDLAVWAPTGTTAWNIRTFLPDGWQSQSIVTLKIFRRQSGTPGMAKMLFSYQRHRDGQVPVALGTSAIDFNPGDTATHLSSFPLTLDSTFAIGDGIAYTISRLGDDPADVYAGNVILDSVWFEFTGIASR